MKYSLILASLLSLSVTGCAGFDTVKTAVAVEGAKAADDVRQSAEWTLCDAISVGAWRRAYAGDPVKADGWKNLCTPAAAKPQ